MSEFGQALKMGEIVLADHSGEWLISTFDAILETCALKGQELHNFAGDWLFAKQKGQGEIEHPDPSESEERALSCV